MKALDEYILMVLLLKIIIIIIIITIIIIINNHKMHSESVINYLPFPYSLVSSVDRLNPHTENWWKCWLSFVGTPVPRTKVAPRGLKHCWLWCTSLEVDEVVDMREIMSSLAMKK